MKYCVFLLRVLLLHIDIQIMLVFVPVFIDVIQLGIQYTTNAYMNIICFYLENTLKKYV